MPLRSSAPSSRAGSPRRRPDLLAVAGLYLVLTLLVWGLLAPWRGLFQDEVLLLYRSFSAGGLLARWTTPIGMPTRVLLGAPSALALATGAPRAALQLLYGLAWLGIGVAADRLAATLFPRRAWLPLFAGAVTLCATSDFLTDSLVAVGYDLSVLAFLGGLIGLLRWAKGGAGGWLVLAVAGLAASLWTTDAALPSALLAPLLLGWVEGGSGGRRKATAAGLWYATLVPYLVVLVPALASASTYAARALPPLAWEARVHRGLDVFGWDLTPWRWALARRPWFPPPAVLVRTAWRGGAGLVAVALFAATALFLRRSRGEDGPAASASSAGEARRLLAAAVCFLLLSAATAAVFGSVQLAEVFYRTQVMTRVWAALAVAAVSAALAAAWPRRAALALVLPALFVGFGTWGGVERQDYYLAFWQRQRAELSSIVATAPRLAADACLLLRVPPRAGYLSTSVPYLARSWTVLLYDDPTLVKRFFLLSAEQGTACEATAAELVCRGERARERERRLPWSKLVVMTYRPEENRYALEPSLPPELLAGADAATVAAATAAYAPEAQILHQPPSPLARELLGPDPGAVPTSAAAPR